ncbi:MAG: T9SS type A sorting domain-containing protein [Ignavibacteriae bacterium]|nr:T9SS type A sorting domain-containing protein [Ignavibacteria bacterium]MBI3363937.1 T9SS type A sorting domain-containing protein [Ignavibacteriota bacterium]
MTAFAIDTLHNRMYAGTAGIYILDTLLTDVHRGTLETPQAFALYQNYPNPFNPTTSIEFDLSQQSTVTLEVFDVLGKRIAMLVNGDRRTAGRYHEEWNADNFPSGIYFYRLTIASIQTNGKNEERTIRQIYARKMLLLR